MAVVLVEVDGGALALGDEIVAIGILLRKLAENDFFDNLCISGEIVRIDEIERRLTINGLRDAVPVAVVDDRDAIAGRCQLVLEVVIERPAIRCAGIAVVVISVGVKPVIGIVSRALIRNR